MPEGDSIHKAARHLSPLVNGQLVRALSLPRTTTATEGLVGQRITGVEARGKNLLVHFEQGLSLHVHLKMNGRIRDWPAGQPAPRRGELVAYLETEARVVGVFDAPVARLLRRRDLTRDFHFRHLGPDLLGADFALEEALSRLSGRGHLPLGVALMDQGAVAGIGNVWKSELCFNRRLNPFAPIAQVPEADLRALLEEARSLMRDNVHAPRRTRPDPFSHPAYKRRARPNPRLGQGPLSVYERSGEPCYECGGPIAMRYQGQPRRSTYYCAACQGVAGEV